MRRFASWIALTASLLFLTACASHPHNDVLIFGTDTKLALDVSADPGSGGTPQVTIGYKRKEAVWMPLIANGNGVRLGSLRPACLKNGIPQACDFAKHIDVFACVGADAKPVACAVDANRQLCLTDAGQPMACTLDLAAMKYMGSGEKNGGQDAYSVFASFGANIKGSAGDGQVGLAQFFATGIAAQRLADNSQVASALSVQPKETGVAMANASAAQSPEIAEAIAKGINLAKADKTNGGLLAACSSLKSSSGTALSPMALPVPTDPNMTSEYAKFTKQLDAAKDEAGFTKVIGSWSPLFDTQIKAVITACGGKPV